MSYRTARQQILQLLRSNDFEQRLEELTADAGQRTITSLLSFLPHPDITIRMRAVAALGVIVASYTHKDPEAARNTVRRLMWSLNPESGSIGWGAPEALGEIMARSGLLADEYGHIMVSFLSNDGNPLENPHLQQGALWGLARLAQVRPDLARLALPEISHYLTSSDALCRALAARITGLAGAQEHRSRLKKLLQDESVVMLYRQGTMAAVQVKSIARNALALLAGEDGGFE